MWSLFRFEWEQLVSLSQHGNRKGGGEGNTLLSTLPSSGSTDNLLNGSVPAFNWRVVMEIVALAATVLFIATIAAVTAK